jgi:hypothetical protein
VEEKKKIEYNSEEERGRLEPIKNVSEFNPSSIPGKFIDHI